jgi:hypothetical protein
LLAAIVAVVCLAGSASAQTNLGVVTGFVRQPDGGPAVGARVAAMTAEGDRSAADVSRTVAMAVTDAEGRYRLIDVPLGRYHIAAGRLEASTYYPGTLDIDSAALVEIRAGSFLQERISFTAQARSLAFRLSGSVTLGKLDAETRSREARATDPAATELTRITVQLFGPGGIRVEAPVSADGKFEFAALPAGAYTASTYPHPFVWSARPIVIEGADLTGVELTVPPTVQRTGRVTVVGGGPVPWFQILLEGPSGVGTAMVGTLSDTEGRFGVSLPLGSHKITVTGIPESYRVESLTHGGTDLLQKPLEVRPGDPTSLEVRLTQRSDAAFKVSGVVVGREHISRSSQAPGVVLTEPSLMWPVTALIKPDGSFEFSRLPAGTYNVELPAVGVDVRAIVVRGDLNDVKLVVPRQVSVRGQLVTSDGVAAPEAVDLIFKRGAERIVANRDRYGNFLVDPLAEGEYSVELSGPYAPFFRIEKVAAGFAEGAEPTIKAIGANVRGARVTIKAIESSPLVRVAGRVVGEAPPADVRNPSYRVALFDISRVSSDISQFRRMEAPVGKDGSFEFSHVLPGTYGARVFNSTPSGGAPVIFPSPFFQPLAVGTNGLTRVEIVYGAPAVKAVTGRILVEGQGPPPPVWLSFVSSTNPAWRILMTPQADGSFITAAPEGEYQISVLPKDLQASPSYQVKSIQYGTTDALSAPVKIQKADSAQLIVSVSVFNPASWVKVTGRIAGQASRIWLTGGPLADLEEIVGSDGSFVFPRVLPGRYTLRALGPRLTRVGDTTREIVVTGRGAHVEFALPQQIPVRGRIRVENGDAMPGLSLSLKGTFRGIPLEPLVVPVIPREDGTFTLDIPEGDYRVETNVTPGYAVRSATYAGTDILGEAVNIGATGSEMTIVAGVTGSTVRVSGKVIDSAGAPATGNVQVALSGSPSLGVTLTARMLADGSFEFPKVLPGRYTARTLPEIPGGAGAIVVVDDKDIAAVELLRPIQRTIRGRVEVEGSPFPPSVLPLLLNSNTQASLIFNVNVNTFDGTFSVVLPEGEYRIAQTGPSQERYQIVSMRYGTIDLEKQPLKIDARTGQELFLRIKVFP